MLRPGHLGVSMAVYAPLGMALAVGGDPELAILGGVSVLGLAMLPDADHRLPLVPHRGPTHSLAFAALVGAVLGTSGARLGAEIGVETTVGLWPFGVVLGIVAVGAHLLADALTPSGVPLFWPVSRSRVSLSLCRADDAVANYGLLSVGIVVVAGAVSLLFRLGVL